jgi:hypothetical protein
MDMKKYTDKEAIDFLDSVAFPRGLSIFQTLKVTYWSLFEKKKVYKLIEGIEKGKSLYFAMKDASSLNRR